MAKKKNKIELAIGKLLHKNDTMMTKMRGKIKPIGMANITADTTSTDAMIESELKRKSKFATTPSPYSKVPPKSPKKKRGK